MILPLPPPSAYLGNVYIADTNNHRIRKVMMSSGIISTLVGTGTGTYSGDTGAASSAAVNQPRGVTVDSSGTLYVTGDVLTCFLTNSSPR